MHVRSQPVPPPPPASAADSATTVPWFWYGWGCVVLAAGLIYALSGSDNLVAKVCLAATPTCPKGATMTGTGTFQLADGFASLAGFTFLAAALERLAEFALAPWWGKVKVADAKVGVAGAAALQAGAAKVHARAQAHESQAVAAAVASPSLADPAVAAAVPAGDGTPAADVEAAKANTKQAADTKANADSVYVTATKDRPTIMLPMAAAAALICSGLHLYLLHSLAKAGLPNTRLAFLLDALLTGFAIAGGSQPFHDLLTNLTASASATTSASATPATSN